MSLREYTNPRSMAHFYVYDYRGEQTHSITLLIDRTTKKLPRVELQSRNLKTKHLAQPRFSRMAEDWLIFDGSNGEIWLVAASVPFRAQPYFIVWHRMMKRLMQSQVITSNDPRWEAMHKTFQAFRRQREEEKRS